MSQGKPSAVATRAAVEERLGTLSKTLKTGTKPRAAEMWPLVFTHFRLLEDALAVEGTPTLDTYVAAGEFIMHAEHGSPFWLADWLNYGDGRAEWAKQIEQARPVRHYKAETLEGYRRVARKVPPERRRPELSFQHHKVVESCSPSEQRTLLARAVDEGLKPAELRREVQATNRRGILSVQAPLAGKFRVVYADPAWIYKDRPPSGSGAQSHYPGMTVEQICKIPVKAHAMPNAVLFMWVTAPILYQCTDKITPDPLRVVKAWGFEYKTCGVWDKVLSAGGHYFATKHEILLVCTRGLGTPDHPTPQPDSVQTIRRPDDFEHSEKPEEYARMIQKMYDGPYVELFARRPREGWVTWGNQVLAELRT